MGTARLETRGGSRRTRNNRLAGSMSGGACAARCRITQLGNGGGGGGDQKHRNAIAVAGAEGGRRRAEREKDSGKIWWGQDGCDGSLGAGLYILMCLAVLACVARLIFNSRLFIILSMWRGEIIKPVNTIMKTE